MYNDELLHYGTKRHSGRYPWGSGDDSQQRNRSFLGYVDELKEKGLTEVDIARGLGITTTQLRQQKSIANEEIRASNTAQTVRLKDKGMSNVAIAQRLGVSEASVRNMLKPSNQEKTTITKKTMETLKQQVDEKGYLDIGKGTELHMGISRTKLKTAVNELQKEGYNTHFVKVEQLGTGQTTSVMVLAKTADYQEVYKNRYDVKPITSYSEDGGRSYLGLEPVRSVNGKQVLIRYGDEGGSEKDGVIELRRGVPELSLGEASYAQVRIGVDGTHYMKGMAMYTDDIPAGKNMIYNTNKPKGTDPSKVYKEMKVTKDGFVDDDNPFGSTVRQRHYIDSKGNKQLSSLNIVNEEGEWGTWSKSLASQMLSKQTTKLAKQQLDLGYEIKAKELDDIMALENPAVKKRLLDAYADGADAAAWQLKAAALPRQASHVILPYPDMKETEIYAPNYRNGETVALIRFPHGGTFEIPELKANNKFKPAIDTIGQAKDAVGINHKVAERLSGADFDGDSVLVIPNNTKHGVKTTQALAGLKNFDPKITYPSYEGMPIMSERTKQKEMGNASNLITDMTIKGATPTEIAAAVRYSMVVIDAPKHKLNYKQAFIDNNVASLKEKYQGGSNKGASTLISKASSEQRVNTRKESIDPKTGKRVYEYTNESYIDKNGKTVYKTTKSTKGFEVDDAFTLSSGTDMERIYAKYSNDMKALANKARKESVTTEYIPYSPEAKKTYQAEVDSLNSKLKTALMNKPLERRAQLVANATVSMKKEDNPELKDDYDALKKVKGQALNEARARVGAKKTQVDISDREWEAIQEGAISTSKLTEILNNADLDKVKQLATPREEFVVSNSSTSRAKAMLSNGYTQAEVADALGLSTSTISKLL